MNTNKLRKNFTSFHKEESKITIRPKIEKEPCKYIEKQMFCKSESTPKAMIGEKSKPAI